MTDNKFGKGMVTGLCLGLFMGLIFGMLLFIDDVDMEEEECYTIHLDKLSMDNMEIKFDVNETKAMEVLVKEMKEAQS